MYKKLKFFENSKKNISAGGRRVGLGQEGCERRYEAFVKNDNKKIGGGGGGWGLKIKNKWGRGSGQVDVNEELKLLY